jgi:hypothetical protein
MQPPNCSTKIGVQLHNDKHLDSPREPRTEARRSTGHPAGALCLTPLGFFDHPSIRCSGPPIGDCLHFDIRLVVRQTSAAKKCHTTQLTVTLHDYGVLAHL